MSSKSNNQGRAYEYAWIKTLFKSLHEIRNTRIVDNSSFEANRRAWETIGEEKQALFKISAISAVDALLELEPLMIEKDDGELLLESLQDGYGKDGDVRDIVISRNNIRWEIGLSIKHNHDAVKHSRLSHRLDFANEWFGMPCSSEYWEAVAPIFERLKEEKSIGRKWSEIDNKGETVYVPLLQAFMDEVNRSYATNSDIPKKMIEYLVGTNDYYKIVSRDGKRLTIIQTFNIRGTLNKPSKVKVSAITVPIAELPTEIVALKFKKDSNNTVEMYLNNGWQLNFRIHNARTKVEQSLKFDVQCIGMPVSVLNIECKWK